MLHTWWMAADVTRPAITLSVIYMALIARMTRASMLGVLREDYIRTKNASLPVVTIIGIGFALLIGGAVVTINLVGDGLRDLLKVR